MEDSSSRADLSGRKLRFKASDSEVRLNQTSLLGASFGGLKGRYSCGLLKDVRLVDPWGGQYLRFPHQLAADSWLLRALDSNVAHYQLNPDPLLTLQSGQLIRAQPAGAGTFRDGTPFLDVVVRSGSVMAEREWLKVSIAGACRNIKVYRRDAATVRANVLLLNNLEDMRSHLVCNVAKRDRGLAAVVKVTQALGIMGPCKCGDVIELLCQYLDTASVKYGIIAAYRSGYIDLDLKRSRLWWDCPIRLLREAH